ncbi:MAG: hypothetical protein H6729_17780 [Deltaproteobacteria bacterium]|nr:hypothetical protein [Deltaproteobacteria bacterium]
MTEQRHFALLVRRTSVPITLVLVWLTASCGSGSGQREAADVEPGAADTAGEQDEDAGFGTDLGIGTDAGVGSDAGMGADASSSFCDAWRDSSIFDGHRVRCRHRR